MPRPFINYSLPFINYEYQAFGEVYIFALSIQSNNKRMIRSSNLKPLYIIIHPKKNRKEEKKKRRKKK
jgi:hypothetical protein